VHEERGQVAASARPAALLEEHFGQPALDLLAHTRGQFAQPGKAAEGKHGVAVDAEFMELPAARQKARDKIERPAHDAASVQPD
jgi:hypothetical protein